MNNSTQPPLQPSVLGELPFEIATRIFSYIDQRECLTCMAVCRSWYSTVPQYSRDAWANISITVGDEAYLNNKRWELCVGCHVRSVTFQYDLDESDSDVSSGSESSTDRENSYVSESSESDEEISEESDQGDSGRGTRDSGEGVELVEAERKLCRAMQKLIDCGCSQVKSLEFKNCPIISQREFSILLQRLVQTATDLTFQRHDMGPDVIDLLDLCPRLTRFSFKHGDYDNRLVETFAGPPKTDEFINLKHLSVEIRDNDLETQLIPVLQKSPNLEHLAYHLPDCFDVDDVFHRTTAIPADGIALWCPRLVSLELSSLYRDRSDEPDTMQLHPIKTSDESPGLRSLIATETEWVGPDTIGPFLLGNADTLEIISLTKYSDDAANDWSSIFSGAEFPNLRSLELYAIGINDAATNRLLTHCPALERLYIYAAENPPMIHLAQALGNLTQLKTIELQSVQIAQDDFDAIIASKSKLERAEFRDVIPMTDTLLQRLSLLQSLKQLHISFSEIRQDHTDAGLHQFVEMLSRTKLQILHLEGLQGLRSDAIQALGNLPCMEWIILCGPEDSSLKCDGPSLVRMIDNCESLKWAKLSSLELTGTDMDLLAYLKQEVKTCKDIRNMPMIGGVCLMK